ncbi:putative tripartite motif-containing protein 16-like [Scophthalmus maximus]|uniref:Putative tripartite motif-containing protein 16-like n=1 Tax=Scophthalmus maximus TaxID=52904 RepID=A0A2U9BGA6_SCOMX|nr:tripartite motif-containing protein 16-like protein isoform X1 [Scophthalmus maximus]AWP02849.1 putative tripartite motif-containing protein 16-like [Scophthalmus maximus]
MAEPRVPVSFLHLCCPVCARLLRDPATLPCGHSFCSRCIRTRWDRDGRNNCPCSCPECGHIFPSAPPLVLNRTLAELVRDTDHDGEERRRLRRPAESESEAESEAPPVPKRGRRSGAHPGSPGGGLCRRHELPLVVYCCTDEEVMCALCASQEHGGHRIGCVGEERRRKQEELTNVRTKSKQILLKQKKKRSNLQNVLEQIQEEARQTVDHCEMVLVSVMDSIQRHYLSVKKLIGAQEKAAVAQVHVFIQTLETKMQEMRKRDAELDQLAQVDSNVHFLQKWPSLQRLCDEDHIHSLLEVSEDPLLPFEFTKRAVEQLGRQLEDFCNKEFASISDTGDSVEQQESVGETEEVDTQQEGEASISQSQVSSASDVSLTEHNEEPTTRAEFLRYACELTLDHTTAHEDLVVSVGDREVKLSSQILRSPFSHNCHPERFIHRRQLLCREGLQAERCYYEIEVEGNKAEIALAYKGMDRRSRTRLSAFGGNANSWSLDRSKGYSVSHNCDSVQLSACPRHQTIGVYVKFKEGTVSFYEVSDSMIFLYKAEAKFTEPLYPGFWLGEKCCIRICDLRQDRQ